MKRFIINAIYTEIEQGLEQIHYDLRFTAYLITIGNCKRKFARGRLLSWDISKVSTGIYLKIQNGRKCPGLYAIIK